MQPATQKPGASPETQHMMSSSRTGLGPAAPPTSALGNRIQSLHHFLQGHLFMSQPEPHSPQRRTVLQPGLPLHQRCFGGGEALGRGLPRRLPGIGPEPRRGGAWGGCSAEAEAVRAPRLSAATWAPSECTPARRARRSTSAPRVQSPGPPRAPADPSTVPRALPRADLGPRPVHPAATWEPRGPAHPAGTSARSPAHPSSPGSLRPSRSGAGNRRGASTEPAHRYLRRPPGRCRGRSSRARPPRAVACRPRRPPRAGRWVRGGPVAGACPRTRGVGGKRAPRLQPRDLAMLGTKPPRAFYTPAPCRSQSCVSPGPAPFPREARTLYAPGP